MSVFGLLHGAGLGAWCWSPTIECIERHGHTALAVDLPLDDQTLGAAQLAEIAVDALAGCDQPILVAHSISGLIAPIIASRRPVTRMIFLHSVLPEPGMSLAQQVQSEPDIFNPAMLSVPSSGWSEQVTVRHFLFHDCLPEVASAAFARLRQSKSESRRLVSEVTPLKVWPEVPCSYVLCQDDRTIMPAWARKAARQRLRIESVELPGGHCPMLSRPADLAFTLLRCLPTPGP